MILENDLDISEFLQVTSSGIRFASFTEIRDALIVRYKSVYGQDIDVSTATADGVYINDLSLLINNILNTMRTMYGNLDVNTASGYYLDTLCRLSNITRKSSTRSIATITLTNNGSSTFAYNDKLYFMDKAGITWSSLGNNFEISANGSIAIQVICDESGPIEAPAQWIYNFINTSSDLLNISINQSEAAIIGLTEETDSSLRARRNQSVGSQGTTVLESLIGELLSISEIKDVKIVENNTASPISASDETSVPGHSVYIIIRLIEGVSINDDMVGQIIYQKLTPGVNTVQFDSTGTYGGTGLSKSIDSRSIESYPTQITALGGQFYFYWKQAVGIHPDITITIETLDFFDKGSDGESGEFITIGRAIIDYMNELKIGVMPTNNNLLIEAIQADPKFKNQITYLVNSVNIDDTIYPINPLTYYNYSSIEVEQDQHDTTIYTITIS